MSVPKFLLRLAIGALLIGLLLYKHELSLHTVLLSVERVPALVLAGALALNLAGQALCAYRWSVLSGIGGWPAGFSSVLPIYFSGMFFNVCLPTSIGGDVFRVVGLGRKIGSKTAAGATVFMDRNIGLAALLLAGLSGSLIAQTTIRATVFKQLYELPVWPAFAASLSGFALINAALFNERFFTTVSALLRRLRLSWFSKKLTPLHEAVGSYRQPVMNYFWPLLLSLIYQASEIGLIALLGYGLGLNLSIWVYASMVAFQAVASLLPITIGGVGVREAIFTAVIVGKLGLGFKDDALALSLLYFFGVVLVSALLGGVVYLLGGVPKPSAAELSGGQRQGSRVPAP